MNYLQMAKQAYDQSTTFIDNNYRQKWEDNIRHFQSRHRSGSKYLKDSYRYRSKIFRPKTRSAVRSNEAAAAAAFFSNQDVVAIEPQNPSDPAQQASADVVFEALQYRLTKSIPWFKVCMGAFQEASVNVCISYQYWDYKEDIEYQTVIAEDEEFKVPVPNVRTDKPCIELVPVEQLRIHPAANWLDPINESPYLIHLIPMYIADIKARMESDEGAEPKWKKLEDDELRTAQRLDFDSTRNTRDGDKEDKFDQPSKNKPLSDFDVVWVHRNIVRVKGRDVVYYTLGTEHLLSDPKPIEQYYFHGERPYTLGITAIEAHKMYPESPVQMSVPLQSELNENANQRADNVKLVMNKRYTVIRGKNVDVKGLLRNVAGGASMVDNHEDIMERTFQDVTGSSYAEQDRLNLDFDDIVGTFSGSTVQGNRSLNETVGGMAMLRGGANALTEYQIKTFAETWVEPVIRQLVKLIQYYETDETVLALAAEKAKLYQKYGIEQVTDDLLNRELTMTANVGMGATDPIAKVERLTNAVTRVAQIGQMKAQSPALQRLDTDEIFKEVFGRLGYKDGARFLVDMEDPKTAQLMAQIEQMNGIIQQLQAALADKEADRKAKLEETLIKEEAEDERLEKELDNKLILKHMDIQDGSGHD